MEGGGYQLTEWLHLEGEGCLPRGEEAGPLEMVEGVSLPDQVTFLLLPGFVLPDDLGGLRVDLRFHDLPFHTLSTHHLQLQVKRIRDILKEMHAQSASEGLLHGVVHIQLAFLRWVQIHLQVPSINLLLDLFLTIASPHF